MKKTFRNWKPCWHFLKQFNWTKKWICTKLLTVSMSQNAKLRSKSGAKIFCIPKKKRGVCVRLILNSVFEFLPHICQEQICANPFFRPVFIAEQTQGCLYSIVLLLSIGLCLVKHESNFQYNAVNDANRDGSKDYGIYQINSNYWCDQPDNTKYSRCWQIRSHGCGYPCSGKS